MTTTDSPWVRAFLLCTGVLLILGAAASPVRARTCSPVGCDEISAQRAKQEEEGLLDKVGLGSLRDVAWEALPAALGLSALIGAAGGFVYAGLVRGGRPAKRSPDGERSDRP